MTDENLDSMKVALDAELQGKDIKNGIKFSHEAYAGFARRGWLRPATYSVFGTGAYPIDLPVYNGHLAIPDFELNDDNFKVGS